MPEFSTSGTIAAMPCCFHLRTPEFGLATRSVFAGEWYRNYHCWVTLQERQGRTLFATPNYKDTLK